VNRTLEPPVSLFAIRFLDVAVVTIIFTVLT
jgi:hypothetical protein